MGLLAGWPSTWTVHVPSGSVVVLMEWWSANLYTIDDGDGYPSVISCVYEGKSGCAILVFSDPDDARRYVYANVGIPTKVRPLERKQVHGKLIHHELSRTARMYTAEDVPIKAVAMVIDPKSPTPLWVAIEDVMDLGLRQRTVAKAKDELWD